MVAADSTTSQDGYGGNANGYGGDAGNNGPTDGYGGSNGEPILQIYAFDVSDTSTNMTFSGQVAGEPNLAGSMVTFGGQLAGYTTTVASNGSFALVVPLSTPIKGAVTVQVTDANGDTSNIATIVMT